MPGTPSEQPGDPMESRMMAVETTLFEISQRLARSEENNHMLSSRCQIAIEGLTRCHQVSLEILGFRSAILGILSFPPHFAWCTIYFCLLFDLLNSLFILSGSFGCGARSYVYSGQLIFHNL